MALSIRYPELHFKLADECVLSQLALNERKLDIMHNFSLHPITATAEYNREEQPWFFRELHGRKVTSFLELWLLKEALDRRGDRHCRP